MSDTYPVPVTAAYSKFMKEITFEVTFKDTAVTAFRLWLCTNLIRLAVWVGGFGGVEFVKESE